MGPKLCLWSVRLCFDLAVPILGHGCASEHSLRIAHWEILAVCPSSTLLASSPISMEFALLGNFGSAQRLFFARASHLCGTAASFLGSVCAERSSLGRSMSILAPWQASLRLVDNYQMWSKHRREMGVLSLGCLRLGILTIVWASRSLRCQPDGFPV